jgi:hypothetical protein
MATLVIGVITGACGGGLPLPGCWGGGDHPPSAGLPLPPQVVIESPLIAKRAIIPNIFSMFFINVFLFLIYPVLGEEYLPIARHSDIGYKFLIIACSILLLSSVTRS